MMIKKEEYRVICWQPATSSLDDQIFADIVPANGVIHDMIFYTRLKLMRGNESAMTIRDIAKSIYLNVIGNNEPEITFAQSTIVSKEQLRSVILKTYYQGL